MAKVRHSKHIFGTPEERFWPKVDRDGPIPERRPELGPCWVWTAGTDGKGYGIFCWSPERRRGGAHRIAYVLTHGPIKPGLDLDHLCRNTICVNPAHLEPVSHRENMLRGDTFAARNVQITHCPQGHEYDEANTRWKRNGTKRDCRACDRERHQAKRDAAKALA